MSNTPQTNLKTEGVSKPCEPLQHLETSTECSLHILKSVNVMQENWTFLSKMINAQRARVWGKIRDYEQTTVKWQKKSKKRSENETEMDRDGGGRVWHRKRVKEQHKQEIKCQGPLYVLNGGADFPWRKTGKTADEKERGKQGKRTRKRARWGQVGERKKIIYIYINFLFILSAVHQSKNLQAVMGITTNTFFPKTLQYQQNKRNNHQNTCTNITKHY